MGDLSKFFADMAELVGTLPRSNGGYYDINYWAYSELDPNFYDAYYYISPTEYGNNDQSVRGVISNNQGVSSSSQGVSNNNQETTATNSYSYYDSSTRTNNWEVNKPKGKGGRLLGKDVKLGSRYSPEFDYKKEHLKFTDPEYQILCNKFNEHFMKYRTQIGYKAVILDENRYQIMISIFRNHKIDHPYLDWEKFAHFFVASCDNSWLGDRRNDEYTYTSILKSMVVKDPINADPKLLEKKRLPWPTTLKNLSRQTTGQELLAYRSILDEADLQYKNYTDSYNRQVESNSSNPQSKRRRIN